MGTRSKILGRRSPPPARFCCAKRLDPLTRGAALRRGKATGEANAEEKRLRLLGDFLHGEGFDNVALLDVVELLDGQAALEALDDLLGVVLEPLQGGQTALMDDDAVPDHTDGAGADDLAVLDVAASRYLGASMPFMAAVISSMQS